MFATSRELFLSHATVCIEVSRLLAVSFLFVGMSTCGVLLSRPIVFGRENALAASGLKPARCRKSYSNLRTPRRHSVGQAAEYVRMSIQMTAL